MLTRAKAYLSSNEQQINIPGRYSFIDVLRACAAGVVLFQHGGEGAGWFSPDTGFGPWINFGQVGVLIFFLVSGFVIPLSLERADSVKTFWKHRIFRIYPLYLTVFAYEIFTYFCGYGSRALFSVQNWPVFLLSHLLLVQEYLHQPNFVGGSWTLSMEFAWYGLLSLALLTKLNKRSVLITAITVAGLLSLSALSLITHIRIPMGRFGIMASCVAGLLFYRLHKKELRWQVFLLLLLSIIIALIPALYVAFGVFDHPDVPFKVVLISWSLAYAIFTTFYVFRGTKLMQFGPLLALGTISYSIYLIPPIIQDLITIAGFSGWGYMFLLIPLTIVCAHITYRYIERPAINYARSSDLVRGRSRGSSVR